MGDRARRDGVAPPATSRASAEVAAVAASRHRSAAAILPRIAIRIAAGLTFVGGIALATAHLLPAANVAMRPFVAEPVLRAELAATMRRYEAALLASRFLEAKELLADARRLALAALGRSPANGFLWAGLAEIEWRQNGFSSQVDDYLARSRLLARHEHQAALVRATLSLKAWPQVLEKARAATVYDLETLLVIEAKHRVIATLADIGAPLDDDAFDVLREVVGRVAAPYLRQFDAAVAERRRPPPTPATRPTPSLPTGGPARWIAPAGEIPAR